MAENKTILLIEDDLYTRDLYRETLTEAGYEVTTAADGLDGYLKIQEKQFDLILVDAMMPKMDGLTILTKLKDLPPTNPPRKIIMCTNLAGDAILNQALEAGATAVIIKTDVNPDQFLEKVKTIITT